MSKTVRHTFGRTLFWLVILIVATYLLFPFYWALNSSLKTETELQRTPATFIPENPVLDNYRAIFKNDRFVRGLLNSLASTARFCSPPERAPTGVRTRSGVNRKSLR